MEENQISTLRVSENIGSISRADFNHIRKTFQFVPNSSFFHWRREDILTKVSLTTSVDLTCLPKK